MYKEQTKYIPSTGGTALLFSVKEVLKNDSFASTLKLLVMDSVLVFSATFVTSSDLFSLDDVLVFDLFRLGLNLRNDVRMYEGASLNDDCFFSGD